MTLPIPPSSLDPRSVLGRYGSVEDVTPEFIRKNYLLGLQFVDENGEPYPDSWYEQKIGVAISSFEMATHLTLQPRLIEGETHDYYINDYQAFAFLQVHHYPLIVDQDYPVVRAVYPTGQTITNFPREWVRADAPHGLLQLVPTQGTLSQVILGQGGSYLPIIYQGLGYLPQLFYVSYRAGFESGKVPSLFLDALAKLATVELLSVIGDSVRPAGVTSQSYGIDGMSESRGFVNTPQFAPVFSGRISQYRRELYGDPQLGIPGLLENIKGYWRGINMWVAT